MGAWGDFRKKYYGDGQIHGPIMCRVKGCFGGGGGWDGAVKFKGLTVGWWRDGRFHGLFIKCGMKIPGLMYMVHREIPDPNCMGVGRFMGPCLSWVGDVPGPM